MESENPEPAIRSRDSRPPTDWRENRSSARPLPAHRHPRRRRDARGRTDPENQSQF